MNNVNKYRAFRVLNELLYYLGICLSFSMHIYQFSNDDASGMGCTNLCAWGQTHSLAKNKIFYNEGGINMLRLTLSLQRNQSNQMFFMITYLLYCPCFREIYGFCKKGCSRSMTDHFIRIIYLAVSNTLTGN